MALRALAFGVGSVVTGGIAYCMVVPRNSQASANRSLPTLRQRFEKFASVGTGSRMTIEDFAASLGGGAELAPPSLKIAKSLFGKVDVNGDGYLSYDEYCMFMSLLSNTSDHFRMAFHMFDRDGNGHLDANEFERIMKALVVDPSAQLAFDGALMEYYFGPKKDRLLSYTKFAELTEGIRKQVQTLEFLRYDSTNSGKTSLANVRRLLYSHSKEKTATRAGDDAISVSKETYSRLCDLILASDKVARSMEIYSNGQRGDAASKGLGRKEFIRALSCCNMKFTPADVDVFFSLFDADGTGTIDSREFAQVVKMKSTMFASHVPRFDVPKRNRVQQFAFCMQQRN